MKKFLPIAAALLVAASAQAAWLPSDTQSLIIAEDPGYEYCLLTELMASDGRLVYTWLDYDGYYALKMQVIDTDGNRMLGDQGVTIMNQPTKSWTTDYYPVLTSDNQLIVAFNDTRYDETGWDQYSNLFIYRYDLEGNPVWDADGVQFTMPTVNEGASCNDYMGMVCLSGDNIYVGGIHSETYTVPATEDNWQPSIYFPDEPMPETVTLTDTMTELQLLNSDGTFAWNQNLVIESDSYALCPSLDGDVIVLFQGDNYNLMAQRYNAQGQSVWAEAAEGMPETLGINYFSMPEYKSDGEGGVVLVARIPNNYYGYVAMNHILANGEDLLHSIPCNGSTDGDGENAIFALRGQEMLVMWEFLDSNYQLNILANEMSIEGDYLWSGDNMYGVSFGANDMWGFKPVAVVPQDNGWVLFYGEGMTWSTANFWVLKIDNYGDKVWKKQISEDNCEMSSINVVTSGDYAYVSYIPPYDYDENWNPYYPDGGLCVMKIDISDSSNTTGVSDMRCGNSEAIYYNLNGLKASSPLSPGVYIKVSDGKSQKVVIR
ncbi:MAG: hypothetical protein LUD17_02980 [Bacteroidales bacterium]|nr:hypothetical protein [Bacteroidales bacterium]